MASARPLAGVKVNVGAARAATDGDSARGGGRSGVKAARAWDSPNCHKQMSPPPEPAQREGGPRHRRRMNARGACRGHMLERM